MCGVYCFVAPLPVLHDRVIERRPVCRLFRYRRAARRKPWRVSVLFLHTAVLHSLVVAAVTLDGRAREKVCFDSTILHGQAAGKSYSSNGLSDHSVERVEIDIFVLVFC